MRNLKKILALVLALVMSFSLMATANAFTDDEKITDTYETAVTVLSGLKVFQGYDDGTFQPQGPITRAEVAAIIYRIVTGDVADTQVGIYADYNKFDDVKSTSWYAGYVNFCANAEYIKGYDAKTFGPNDPVTGYQALAMILRALGYDKNGEFTGASWQVQTAAVGENRGITKNISAGTLGTAATREVVAEILFRAILVEKVNYTPAFGYQLDDTSIGWDTFELEEIEGVVIANEYADLYGTEPLKAGRTEMDVDGETYSLAYTTTFDDIGEARYAYVTEGKNVLAIGDAGNTVFETGAEADIATASKFEKVTGLERTTDTEQFINFEGGNTYEASDWRIEYVVDFSKTEDWTDKDGADLVKANGGSYNDNKDTYTKTIKVGGKLTSTDLSLIKGIFAASDEADENDFIGEVYVGTQSSTDISDEISYKQFVDKYVVTDENAVAIDENENGNWLKAIDNDGDGEADVVLQVIYTVAGVQKVAKDGTITLSCEDDTFDNDDALNEITDDNDVVTEDELAEGDIVYYALIDGNAYTYKAEVVTAKIDKVNRNTLTATTTDGDEYVESGVHEHSSWDEIVSGVRNLAGDVNYDLYLDRFGYLAAFTESDNNAGFVLLTDGYYETGRTNDTFAAMVWDREEQKLVDTDITDGGKLFINTNGDDNDWGNLHEFIPVNCTARGDDIHTIVAALGEDGSLTPVDEIYRYRMNVAMIDMDTTIPVRAHTENGTIYSTTRDEGVYGKAGASVDVRALASTVYYYVYNTPNGNTVVREYVGYANIPDLGKDADKVEDVYVVGTRAEDARDDEYYTAEIVVVELEDGYTEIDSEQVFIYDLPVVGTGVKYEEVSVIRADGTTATVTIDLDKSNFREYDPALGKDDVMPGLYYMWESDVKDVYVIDEMSWNDIAANRYVVGTVLKDTATGADDWTSFTPYYNNTNYITDLSGFVIFNDNGETEKRNTADTKYYELDYSENKYGDYVGDLTEGDREDVLPQRKDGGENEVLVKYNSDNEIVYAISFAQWENEKKGIVDFAQDVWAWNTPAAKEIVVSDYEKAVAAAEDALAANPHVKGDLEEALKLLNDLDTTSLTVEQEAYVNALVADIGTALQPFADAEALAEAKTNAIDAMKAAIVGAVEAVDTGDIIKDYEAVLTDDTTDISATGWGAGYETVKKALDKWTEEINGKRTIAEVNSHAAAIAGNYAGLASAYVAAVAADQTTAGYKAQAAVKAKDYMSKIKTELAKTITWAAGQSVKSLVETAISGVTPDGNAAEYTCTVSAPADVSFTGDHGTKTVDVEVSVTNSYAGVVCDPVTETISVTFSW